MNPQEAQNFLNSIQGEWDIVPISVPQWISRLPTQFRRRRRRGGRRTRAVSYTKAFVRGSSYTLTGGNAPPNTQHLTLMRGTWTTPTGAAVPNTIFVDSFGSVITTYAPQQGVLEWNSGLNVDILWRRPPQMAQMAQMQTMQMQMMQMQMMQSSQMGQGGQVVQGQVVQGQVVQEKVAQGQSAALLNPSAPPVEPPGYIETIYMKD